MRARAVYTHAYARTYKLHSRARAHRVVPSSGRTTRSPKMETVRVECAPVERRTGDNLAVGGNLCQQRRPLLHGYRVITCLFFYEYFFFNLFSHPIFLSQASSRRRRRRSACLRRPAIRVGHRCWRPGACTRTHARTRPTIHTRCFSPPNTGGRFGSTTRFPRKPAPHVVLRRKIKIVYYQSPRSSAAAAAAQPYPRTFRPSTTTTTTKRPTRIPNVPHAHTHPPTVPGR